jgi:predicted O-methyltransferase YrrM
VLEGRSGRERLLDLLPRCAVCAEIGVWRGDFSARILAKTCPAELHLIDPWEFQPEFPDRAYGGSVATGARDMERLYERVTARFAGRPNVTVHRAFSDDCLTTFPDRHFDWIYIDGNHYYDFVKRDLELAIRKVRPGGVVAGDDYHWGEGDGYPVKRAVLDVLHAHGMDGSATVIGSQFAFTVRPQAIAVALH